MLRNWYLKRGDEGILDLSVTLFEICWYSIVLMRFYYCLE